MQIVDEWKLDDLIASICNRPGMYSPMRNMYELSGYINGFCTGRGGEFNEDMKRFQEWISYYCYRKYGKPRNYIWYWYLSQEDILIDDDFMKTLLTFFKRYRSEYGIVDDVIIAD